MAATASKIIIMTIVLAVFLNISGLTIAIDETCKTNGEFCGGIAAFQCCEGLVCKFEGEFPDAGGECKPKNTTCQKVGEPCGGFVIAPSPECCEGLECKYDGSGAFDVPGKCMPKSRTCPKIGEFCGGIAAIQCCKGLKCVLDGDFPDAGGICKKGCKQA